MPRKIAAIDCDNVLAASDIAWEQWLDKRYVRKEEFKYNILTNTSNTCYDFSVFYEACSTDAALDFFRREACYVGIPTVQGAYEGIKSLKDMGFEIVVVSHVKGNHHKSKWHWIQDNFPSLVDGFIATKEKYYIKADMFVDDRNNHCNVYKERHRWSRVYRLDTPYTQIEPLNPNVICGDWTTIISNELEVGK